VANFTVLTVVKTVHTSSVRCSSAKTERNFDLVNFSVEYMVLADSYLLKYGSRSWSSWTPLLYNLSEWQHR
jgi:hypothetical protein